MTMQTSQRCIYEFKAQNIYQNLYKMERKGEGKKHFIYLFMVFLTFY